MEKRKSLGSTLVFLGTFLCFFLPFVTVSCHGRDVFTVTGRQLATGSAISRSGGFGGQAKQQKSANPFAAIAALSAVSGLILSVVGKRMIRGVAISGAIGTASLAAMKVQLDYQIHKDAMGMAQNNYQVGVFSSATAHGRGNWMELLQAEAARKQSRGPHSAARGTAILTGPST